MFLPWEVEHEEHERQEQPWLVYGMLTLLAAVHGYLFLHLNDAQRLDLWFRFGASRMDFHWYSALTCTLLHADVLHLVGNCYMLWIYGGAIERLIGWRRFLLLWVLGAYGSILAHVATTPVYATDEPAIGASGAIAALLGAFLAMMPRAKLRCLFFSVVSFKPVQVLAPAWLVLGLWFISQLGFSLGLVGEIEGIAFWAHVAGFSTGAGVGALLQWRHRRRLDAELAMERQPYLDAWRAYLNGDPEAARRAWEPDDNAPIIGSRGGPGLLAGLLAVAHPTPEDPALPRLRRAFDQARDYGDPAKALTAYLQLLKLVPASLLPADLHRAAGFCAYSLGRVNLALFAFHEALKQDPETRFEALVRALAGLYRRIPERRAEAAAFAAMLPPDEPLDDP